MNARNASRLARSIWAASVILLTASIGTALFAGLPSEEVVFVVVLPLLMLTTASVGALIASRHPRNAIGWIFLGTGLMWGLGITAAGLAEVAAVGRIEVGPWVLFLDWVGTWIVIPAVFAPVTFVPLLFPNGRLLSRRWRPVAWTGAASVVVLTLSTALRPGRPEGAILLRHNPYGVGNEEVLDTLAGIFWVVGLLAIVASAAALVIRLRRSRGEERQQVKSLAYAGLLAAFLYVIAALGWGFAGDSEVATDLVLPVLQLIGLLVIPVAAGVAILKHRLYDIDVVIRKTVVFGFLAAFITLIYAAVVLLIPIVGFGASEPVALLPALATVAVALAFQPLRRRANRFANRLVYGKRATPYELLSGFSQRAGGEYAIEDVLPTMARILGEGTGARRADVWLRVGRELRRAASWPSEAHPEEVLPFDGSSELPAIPDSDFVEPVRHRGELLGALSVTKPRGEDVRPAEEQLLRDLASQAGLVLRNVRLTAELEARLADLRESRQRLVGAQDEERRRLERNIHDGAQQQLVALAVKLRLVEKLAANDPARAAAMAAEARAEAQEALDDLRDLARGIYPPLLADQGLAAALEAQARKASVPIAVQPNGIGRYPAEVEATVYFCVLEALQNVTKYADASQVSVRLLEDDGTVMFAVEDDGRGFDLATAGRGAGLQNMADRVEALGGTVEVRSSPGHGTTIVGRLPGGVGA
jgi:signal transduction histidine kinase